MITRIGCGGFDIDNDTLIEEDGVLKAKTSGGGGGDVLVVHVVRTATEESETFTLDKTWQELADALNSGKTLSFIAWDSNENVGVFYFWSISYLVVALYKTDWEMNLETDSPDGYPTVTIESTH